jgi:predicted Zn-dependent protease
MDLKRYPEAGEQYKWLIGQKPDYYYYHLQLGSVYQRQKKYKSAEKAFEDAKRLAPDKALPVFYLADLAITRGKLGKAEVLVKEALKLEPGDAYGYVLLGDIYLRRGFNYKKAWDKKKAKSNCPKLESAMSNLRVAISHYTKAAGDDRFRTYVRNEITRCKNWIKGLGEDKWFYCK